MRKLVILGLVNVLFGCGILGLYNQIRIGVLSDSEVYPVVVPDSVAVGENFTVIVYTDGGDCIRHKSTRVDMEGNVVTITPYDIHKIGGFGACQLYLVSLEHKATVRFTKKGRATVVIQVYRGSEYRSLRLLRRTVHVY